MQHLPWEDVADAGDRAGGAAVEVAVDHGGVDADGEGDVVVAGAGDVLGGVAECFLAAELLEADEVGVVRP